MTGSLQFCFARGLPRQKLFMSLAVGLFAAMTTWKEAAMHSAYAAESLRVMTFNLRYASEASPNAWPDRRPAAADVIKTHAPDVIGTQEGLYQQLQDIAADSPDFDWIGAGREGGSRGEFMAVFYRKARLQPLEYDHYWLSDTPAVIGSTSWGNTLPRMVTCVRFLDRATGQEFQFINTHFDHRSQPAREASARLILQKSQPWFGKLPVLLVGDFNAAAGDNPAYSTLTADGAFADSWLTARFRGPAVGTFHNYAGPTEGDPRIDWILTQGPVSVAKIQVVTDNLNGQYPSDHFPVVSELSFDP